MSARPDETPGTMRGAELLLGCLLLRAALGGAEGEPEGGPGGGPGGEPGGGPGGEPGHAADDLMLVSGFNESREAGSRATQSPHTEDRCRGYYDVMGQWDPPFVCRTGSYLYCCGTCGFRFCCAFKSSRLDQSTCKNYDTPPWMMTGRPPPKVDVALDAAKDKTNLIVYVICGVVAIMALIGIFTKLGLEKTQRPHGDNMSRALAHVIRHPASEHSDEMGLGPHYENIQTRVALNSLHSPQMNNAAALLAPPYPSLAPLSSPYETPKPIKDLNKYATLKAVAEKTNDSFYGSRRQQLLELTQKGSLPMEPVEVEPEPSNPYSPPRPPRPQPAKHDGHKHRSPKSRSAQSLCYGSNAAASPAALRCWESKDALGLRQSYGQKKLCLLEKELRGAVRYVPPPQPYFVTNSKTEVTV